MGFTQGSRDLQLGFPTSMWQRAVSIAGNTEQNCGVEPAEHDHLCIDPRDDGRRDNRWLEFLPQVKR
jgi:hypothetical protein